MASVARSIRCAAARCVLPWTRHKLPGWRYAAGAVCSAHDGPWLGLPMVECVGKLHGYRLRLDRADWSERQMWFFGCSYEYGPQALIIGALRPGDTFVDIGANIGMISLLAASRVGETGIVLAFEPNPAVYDRLIEHVRVNRLEGIVKPMAFALAQQPGELTLNIPEGHCGMASFGRPRDLPQWSKQRTAVVHVERGDVAVAEVLGARPGPVFVKIDVEGFEREVLGGLEETLRRYRPAVLAECNEDMLRHAGSSEGAIREFMTGLGYVAFEPGMDRATRRLTLRRLTTAAERHEQDMLWLVPGGVHAQRLGCDA